MPQIIVHLPSSVLDERGKNMLAGEIWNCLPSVLGIPENIGQVFLYETPAACRAVHAGRDPGFVFLEIFMYPGRTPEMKKNLTDRFIELIHRHTGVRIADILCVVNEIPPENYFGGTSHPHIENLKKK